MCKSIKLTLFSALFVFCLAGQSLSGQDITSPETQEQNLTQTLKMPDGLWSLLLEQTQSLPLDFESFTANLTEQVDLLKSNNQLLIVNNQDLTSKNKLLTDNNQLLTESLKLSESKVAISEAKSKQLQTDLDASTLSITKAEAHAKALEFQIVFLKVGCVTLGVSCVALVGYEAGRYYKLW